MENENMPLLGGPSSNSTSAVQQDQLERQGQHRQQQQRQDQSIEEGKNEVQYETNHNNALSAPSQRPNQESGALIETPGDHDLLLGRGGETNSHNGNILFRRMIEQHKALYLAAPRRHKPQIAMALVAKWKALDPPGRFLTKSKSSHHWYEIDDETAKKRTSKSLGERKGMHPSTSSSSGGQGGGSSVGGSGGSLSDTSATKQRQRISASPASAAPTAASTASRKSSSNSRQDVSGLKQQQQEDPETPPQAPSLSGHLFNNQAGTLTGGDAFEGYTLDRAATSPEIMTRMLLLQQQQQHHIESSQPLRQQQDWPMPLHHHEVAQRPQHQEQKQQSPTSKDELDEFTTSSVGAFNMGNHPQHGAAAGVGEREGGLWDTNNNDTQGNLQQRPLSMENMRDILPTAEELTRSCFDDDD